MPLYHFHAENGRCFLDPDGLELPDVEAAKREAVQFMVDSLRDDTRLLWDTRSYRVIVTDEADMTLFTLDLSACLAPVLNCTVSSSQTPHTGRTCGRPCGPIVVTQ